MPEYEKKIQSCGKMSKNVFVADTRNGGKVSQVIYLSV